MHEANRKAYQNDRAETSSQCPFIIAGLHFCRMANCQSGGAPGWQFLHRFEKRLLTRSKQLCYSAQKESLELCRQSNAPADKDLTESQA